MVDVRVPVRCSPLRRTVLRLGKDMELSHEERGLFLGEGRVLLGEEVRLGVGVFA